MPVPAAKVKALCTSAEASLVRASRKAELEQLGAAEVKKLAVRARQLRDKWRDLNRRQARGSGTKPEVGEAATNSHLKEEIFQDTLSNFEARLAQLEKSDAPTKAKATSKSKQDRSAEHRATRAAVRKGLSAAEDLINADLNSAPRRKTSVAAPAKPAVAAAPAKTPAAHEEATKVPAKKGAAKLRPPVAKPAKAQPPKHELASKGKQRQLVAAAKQARVAKSGKTTRLRAHVKSQGKRVQARRDGR